jgi:hypothetical protein
MLGAAAPHPQLRYALLRPVIFPFFVREVSVYLRPACSYQHKKNIYKTAALRFVRALHSQSQIYGISTATIRINLLNLPAFSRLCL